MAIQEDKILDPNNKARWGFAGTEGKITVGPQTVGETGGVDTARTPVDEKGARGNGGGADVNQLTGQVSNLQMQLAQAQADLEAEKAKNTAVTDPRDSLTIPEIKEQLDAKDVKHASTLNKAELLDLLKAQPETQE